MVILYKKYFSLYIYLTFKVDHTYHLALAPAIGFCSFNRTFEPCFKVEDRRHLEKTQILFGFLLDLHYLCQRI